MPVNKSADQLVCELTQNVNELLECRKLGFRIETLSAIKGSINAVLETLRELHRSETLSSDVIGAIQNEKARADLDKEQIYLVRKLTRCINVLPIHRAGGHQIQSERLKSEINAVLESLRELHRSETLPSDVISKIQSEKARANLDGDIEEQTEKGIQRLGLAPFGISHLGWKKTFEKIPMPPQKRVYCPYCNREVTYEPCKCAGRRTLERF